MTPERFREARTLFDAALERQPVERLPWLRQACKDDPALLADLERLIAADRLAGQGLELTLASASLTASVLASLPSFEGRRVGTYQVGREIGRGGMGTVYLATRADNVFTKELCFKVVRPERSDAEVLRRFHQEREIVSRLDHPNIARMLDGGTTEEGLPYAIMEYVDGEPIDVYCDTHRLTVVERVELVRTVCAAVQYAHQNLVIHRDLKPSNIVVKANGTVKLLDFGIAKLVRDVPDEEADASFNQRLFTLAYASPEQIRGDRITTMSDVYSLGVILYELVTGRQPFSTRGLPLHLAIEAICERDPVPPSHIVGESIHDSDVIGDFRPTVEDLSAARQETPARLARSLSGELDTIILKALGKEAQRRYGSAEQFSDDLHRHLSGLPVLAQRDTAWYRTRKFVTRHRGTAIAGGVVLATLLTAAALASWQARIADRERRNAEAQSATARFEASRAEQQTREAQFYRQRAEQEASLAQQQLLIAKEQTAQANASARATALARQRAERRTRDTRAVTDELLALNANLPDLPAAIEGGQRAATTAAQVLSGLLRDGVSDPTLDKSLAAAQELVGKYRALEAGVTRAIPPGWAFATEDSDDYEFGLDAKNSIDGSSAFVRARHSPARGSARFWQSIVAAPYHGLRVRVSALLKSRSVDDAAGIFVRVIDDQGFELFDSLGRLPVRGTNDWAPDAIVFDVSDDAAEIMFGFTLRGGGTVWADRFAVEKAEADVPLTMFSVIPTKPINLDFETRGK